jgi:hypothetical protein
MSKPEPTYLVEIKRDGETIRSRVISTFQPLDDMRYYSVLDEDAHGSIADALFYAVVPIADFMGREWL